MKEVVIHASLFRMSRGKARAMIEVRQSVGDDIPNLMNLRLIVKSAGSQLQRIFEYCVESCN